MERSLPASQSAKDHQLLSEITRTLAKNPPHTAHQGCGISDWPFCFTNCFP
jgi:hypothetical protein